MSLHYKSFFSLLLLILLSFVTVEGYCGWSSDYKNEKRWQLDNANMDHTSGVGYYLIATDKYGGGDPGPALLYTKYLNDAYLTCTMAFW